MTDQHNSQFLDINGMQLYVEHHHLYANRPTLVFLHDSLGCSQLWRAFPQKLAAAAGCNILMYDRLGYGQSAPMPEADRPVHYMEDEAAVLDRLLDQLNIKDAILFGHSDGATIALITAAKYPERIKAIICEAAHIFVEEITLNGIREAIKAYRDTDLPLRLQKYHGTKTDRLFKAWTETWTREDYRNWNIEHLLTGISCPLLFIQGDADEYGSAEQVSSTIAAVRGSSQMYMIPGTGHTPHKETPELVLDTAAAFIKSIG